MLLGMRIGCLQSSSCTLDDRACEWPRMTTFSGVRCNTQGSHQRLTAATPCRSITSHVHMPAPGTQCMSAGQHGVMHGPW